MAISTTVTPSPPSAGFGEVVALDEGVLREQLADGVAHLAGAFAVDDAQAGKAGAEAVVEELLDLGQGLVQGLAAHLDLLRRVSWVRWGRLFALRDRAARLFDAHDLAEADAGAQAAEGDVDLAAAVGR